MDAQWIRDQPLKRKLSGLTLLIAGVALLLAFLGFFSYELLTFRASTIDELSARAAVIGRNSTGAVVFDDSESAGQMLEGLRAHPKIEGACIYAANGSLFAEYRAETSAAVGFPDTPRDPGAYLEGEEIRVFQDIMLDGERVGTILVSSNLAQIEHRLKRYLLIALLVMVVCFSVAIGLSAMLQSLISGPILHLVETARAVSDTKDYKVRATKNSNDELGVLVGAFNEMLAQIYRRDQLLQHHRSSLEEQVAARTADVAAASRRAGMSEIANGVLHDVGNVLTSVNLRVQLMGNKVRKSKVSSLEKVGNLLVEHGDDLGSFLTEDAKGRRLPTLVEKLARELVAERDVQKDEIDSLQKNVDHISNIIATQQQYSGSTGVLETLPLQEIVEAALSINAGSLERRGILLSFEHEEIPAFAIDKHRVLQILVNRLSNARQALIDAPQSGALIKIRINRNGDIGVCTSLPTTPHLVVGRSACRVGVRPSLNRSWAQRSRPVVQAGRRAFPGDESVVD